MYQRHPLDSWVKPSEKSINRCTMVESAFSNAGRGQERMPTPQGAGSICVLLKSVQNYGAL